MRISPAIGHVHGGRTSAVHVDGIPGAKSLGPNSTVPILCSLGKRLAAIDRDQVKVTLALR